MPGPQINAGTPDTFVNAGGDRVDPAFIGTWHLFGVRHVIEKIWYVCFLMGG